MTAGPIFAKYQPQAILTVPGGHHATCTAKECVRGSRRINPGGFYVVMERTAANKKGRAEHFDCYKAANAALLRQAQLDASTPPVSESEVADS